MSFVLCRRSLMQYLESRVTPLLAGILAYVDTNNNLDVLDSAVDSSEQWLRDMWFHMLSDSNVTVLKYRWVLVVCLSADWYSVCLPLSCSVILFSKYVLEYARIPLLRQKKVGRPAQNLVTDQVACRQVAVNFYKCYFYWCPTDKFVHSFIRFF